MEFMLIDHGQVKIVEGQPDTPFMRQAGDVNRVIEACLSEGAGAALLYAANLPPAFFDLSSGQAGEILQKLRNYHIRFALVCPAGTVTFSTRFAELLADERRGSYFGVFETPEAAREWLGQA
jgi:hypothetical protein